MTMFIIEIVFEKYSGYKEILQYTAKKLNFQNNYGAEMKLGNRDHKTTILSDKQTS